MDTQRSKKGQVSIYSQDGYLRLRWRHEGKRYTIALGLLEHDAIARQLAQQRANTIQLDMLSGNFDSTLAKYKPKKIESASSTDPINPRRIYETYLEFKRSQVSARTFEKYHCLLADLQVTDSPALLFEYLSDRNNSETIKRKFEWLDQAYKYAGIENPFKVVQKSIKIPPKLTPRPFTKDEVDLIMQGFKEMHPHYLPYVQFCFSTGVRIQEANALLWEHISDDLTIIQILDNKRHKRRSFKLPELAIAALKSVDRVSEFIFTTKRGCRINHINFRTQYWLPVLEAKNVDYRRPYLARSTAISHALAKGANPMAIAAVTGHDVQTLYRDYAGFIESSPTMPDLF